MGFGLDSTGASMQRQTHFESHDHGRAYHGNKTDQLTLLNFVAVHLAFDTPRSSTKHNKVRT